MASPRATGYVLNLKPRCDPRQECRRGTLAWHVLHRQQIALLGEWRELRQRGDEEGAAALLPGLLLTVNAIASGLGATGQRSRKGWGSELGAGGSELGAGGWGLEVVQAFNRIRSSAGLQACRVGQT